MIFDDYERKEGGDGGRLFHRYANAEAVRVIKHFEGLSLTAYSCPGKLTTIGYGHTGGILAGEKITAEQAERYLDEDLWEAENTVNDLVTVPLNDNQFSALVSFVFNVGGTAFARSTLLKLLNRGWYDQVPAQLARWRRVKGEVMGGLARRRAAEGQLWQSESENSSRLINGEEKQEG